MKLLGTIKNQNGMSLIEILVTMVIFVAGILYALQLFPGGFSSVRQTEFATIANRLAQSELERLKGRVENLPESILAIDPQDINNNILDIDPESMKTLDFAPIGQERFFSDANRFRRIIGESTKIPAPMPSDNDWQGGSMYMLNFSPINQAKSVSIYSNPMKRQQLPAYIPWLIWMSDREYSIDYKEGVMYIRRSDFDREYLISFSYWDQSGTQPRLVAVKKIKITVTAKTDTDPDPEEIQLLAPDPNSPSQNIWVKDIPGFAGIEDNTDTVRRKFIDLTSVMAADGSVPWSVVDPYEFVLRDPAAGIISFNPLGYDYTEITSSGSKVLTAYIDYDVMDWHVIRDERRVPAAPQTADDDYIDVRLSLRSIKNAGSRSYDDSIYPGVTPDLPYSVIAVDNESGRTYNEDSLVDVVNVPALSVNYRDGVVGFHKSLHDKSFTIMYQAEQGWAIQVFKASAVYNRRYDIPVDLNTFGYDSYYMGTDERLYFPRCFAGATLAISYSYKSDGQDAIKFAQGESFQISNDVDSTTGLCYVDIKQKLLDSGKTNVQIMQVSKVYGTSIGVRTIWRVSGKGLTSSWRWRKVDVQTYLTRPIN